MKRKHGMFVCDYKVQLQAKYLRFSMVHCRRKPMIHFEIRSVLTAFMFATLALTQLDNVGLSNYLQNTFHAKLHKSNSGNMI